MIEFLQGNVKNVKFLIFKENKFRMSKQTNKRRSQVPQYYDLHKIKFGLNFFHKVRLNISYQFDSNKTLEKYH